MTIHIDDGKKARRIWLPTALLCNRLTAMLLSHSVREHDVKLSVGVIASLLHELSTASRYLPDRTLVEVETADGMRVRIRI